jgi:hypothetical protein
MHSYHCPHDLETLSRPHDLEPLSRSDPDLWRGIY